MEKIQVIPDKKYLRLMYFCMVLLPLAFVLEVYLTFRPLWDAWLASPENPHLFSMYVQKVMLRDPTYYFPGALSIVLIPVTAFILGLEIYFKQMLYVPYFDVEERGLSNKNLSIWFQDIDRLVYRKQMLVLHLKNVPSFLAQFSGMKKILVGLYLLIFQNRIVIHAMASTMPLEDLSKHLYVALPPIEDPVLTH